MYWHVELLEPPAVSGSELEDAWSIDYERFGYISFTERMKVDASFTYTDTDTNDISPTIFF